MKNNAIPLDVQVFITEEDDTDIYVKLTGFKSAYEAESYAEFLVKYLPLMLFESDVLH